MGRCAASFILHISYFLIVSLGIDVSQVEDPGLPKLRGIGSRWIDLLGQPNTQDKEKRNPILHNVLSQRDYGKVHMKNQVAVSSKFTLFSGNEEKFLWCFLLREDAGIVTQMRHLVDCNILAKKLKRTMISPPILASGMDPLVWPRFWDELVDLSRIGMDNNGSSRFNWHPGCNTKASENDISATVDIFTETNTRAPKWIREFMSKFLGFKQTSMRRHGTSDTSVATLGKNKKNQHTLFVAFDSEMRRKTEPIVAALQPGQNHVAYLICTHTPPSFLFPINSFVCLSCLTQYHG